MSWSEIIFKNEARRQELTRKIQQFDDALAGDFRATNKLATFLNENADQHFQMIEVDHTKTVKENANLLITQIQLIQSYLENVHDQLKQELDPDLFRRMSGLDMSFEAVMRGVLKAAHVAAITGVASTTGAAVGTVGIILVNRMLITRMASQINRIALSAVAGTIIGGIAGFAVDVVAGAIVGAKEKHELEKAIGEVDQELNEFLPVSHEYTDTVFEVLAQEKVWKEHQPNTLAVSSTLSEKELVLPEEKKPEEKNRHGSGSSSDSDSD